MYVCVCAYRYGDCYGAFQAYIIVYDNDWLWLLKMTHLVQETINYITSTPPTCIVCVILVHYQREIN